MTVVKMTDARHEFTDIANMVMFSGERVYISKNNKPAFAVVPLEDAEALEALEKQIDLHGALEALKEKGSITLKQFKKKLGMQVKL